MREYDKGKPLISIHVPKCGGTSLTRVLRTWFGKRFYRHYFDEKNVRMPPRHRTKGALLRWRFRSHVCIHGHFNKARGMGATEYYPESEQFITILRDPFEAALSNYFYGIKMGRGRFRDGVQLSTTDQFKDIADYFRQRRSYFLDYLPCEMTPDDYREILDRDFVYIGILEDMQTSINTLARKLGFPSAEAGYENISERREDVPKELREEFRSNHELEYAIYEFALQNYKR